MTIYEKSSSELFKHFIPEKSLGQQYVFTKDEIVEWFAQKYPKIERPTVECHLTKFSTNAKAVSITKLHLKMVYSLKCIVKTSD